MNPMNPLDRTAISVGTFEDQRREDHEYWMSRPARERFLGIEKLRLAYYGGAALRRFERVLEVSETPQANATRTWQSLKFEIGM